MSSPIHGQINTAGEVWCGICKVYKLPQDMSCGHVGGKDIARAEQDAALAERHEQRERIFASPLTTSAPVVEKERTVTSEVSISWWKYPGKEPQIQLTADRDSGAMAGHGYMVLSVAGAEELIKQLDRLIEAHHNIPA